MNFPFVGFHAFASVNSLMLLSFEFSAVRPVVDAFAQLILTFSLSSSLPTKIMMGSAKQPIITQTEDFQAEEFEEQQRIRIVEGVDWLDWRWTSRKLKFSTKSETSTKQFEVTSRHKNQNVEGVKRP